jgi:hypothetical protein
MNDRDLQSEELKAHSEDYESNDAYYKLEKNRISELEK